jgi:NhaP-type Na+/H+ or K+/H+ antiporter
MYENLAILALFVFLYSAISGRLERTPFSGALIYTAFGLIFGPLCLDFLELEVDAELVRTLAELTLALLLYSDAANTNLGELRKTFRVPQRMLLIGLPLTILLGFGTGVVLFKGLGLLEIAVLATMLAPTDAALGKAVVSNKVVPSNIRASLNVESGLNDGICVPILFLFLALITQAGTEGGTTLLAFKLVAEEIGIGAGVGVVLTLLGRKTLRVCNDREWITDTWKQLCVPALALACFTLAQSIHGSGFIACFVGGLVFARVDKKYKPGLLHAAEGTGDTLALLTWVVFGVGVVGRRLEFLSWEIVLYSVLSLTVIRMLPVFLVLIGMGLRTDEKLFLGWFGPRGLASIVFAVIVFNENLPGETTISTTVVCTVILSIIAHGISANPLAKALGARISRSTEASG